MLVSELARAQGLEQSRAGGNVLTRTCQNIFRMDPGAGAGSPVSGPPPPGRCAQSVHSFAALKVCIPVARPALSEQRCTSCLCSALERLPTGGADPLRTES